MANAAYAEWADAAANKYGIPTGLFRSLIKVESGWNPVAISPAGAYGLTQLMPGTASDMGVNKYDVRQNIEGGAKYLAEQFKKFGNWKDALAAYNAGPGNYTFSGAQSYAQTVLSGAGMAETASSGNTASSGSKSIADTIHDWLYGEGTARLGLSESGQIQGTNAAGETANLSAPSALMEGISKLFTWEFWQSIFSNAMAAVAVVALIAFGIYSLLNQAKAIAK